MVEYKTILPPPQLAAYVKFFWIFEADNLEDPLSHVSTASIYPKLTFNYRGSFKEVAGDACDLPTSGIQGQTKMHCNLVTKDSSVGVFGVYLQPYAIPFLFSIPADVFSNQVISLPELLGSQGLELEESVMQATSHRERIKIVTGFLVDLAAGVQRQDHDLIGAVNCLSSSRHIIDLKEFASSNFLSQRQFERKFKGLSGFSPKLFSRISRFETAINTCINTASAFTDIAYECGYYDQSHFNRDFKDFTGLHPSAYLSDKEYLSLFS